jgi:pimeloyl-ACP methyl ester carboxylesterase
MVETIQFEDVRLRTGVRLRYADAGPIDGRPVLLLHGYSDSSFSFSGILESMPRHVRCIVPDQRGHGESERPSSGSYAIDDFAADGLSLLDALGIPSAIVLGHSMGSFVALRMAACQPGRVSRLVLVGSAANSGSDAVLSLGPPVEQLSDPVDEEFVREFQMSCVHRPVPEEFMRQVIAESRKLPASVWRAILAHLIDAPEYAGSGAIHCPTHLFWGDRDAIFGRKDQEELLESIPGAKLHVFRDVGHAPHWEAPEDFQRELLSILE